MNHLVKYYSIGALGFCLLLTTKPAAAQILPDDSPQAKAITTAMINSTAYWNQGKLDDFMQMYDPSATMMSRCLFPDTKGQYPNQ